MTVTKSYSLERVTLLQNTNGDSQPALAALANGGFVSILTHGGVHLDGNIFSPNGVSTAILDQMLGTGSAVDQLANGNIVVASLSGGDIFHTIRNGSTGAQITAAKAIGGGVDPQNLAVTALTGGRFAIAHDQQNSSRDVGIEVFNSDGSDAWFNLAGNFSKEAETNPALAGLSNGNLAYAFQSDTDGIYVGVFGPNGEIVKDRGQTGFDNTGTINRNVSMTATGDGFAVVYEDNEWDGGNDITLARFALDGTLIGKTRINEPAFDYKNPSVTMLSNGMLAVTATFNNGDTDMDVMLVDASNGATLKVTTIYADEDILDNVDFSTVAGVGHGRLAAQWTNTTDKSVDGELLDVTVVSTGNGADDVIVADYLKDVIDGGDGNDTVSYANSDGAVTVTINAKGFNFHAANDTLENVENLIGSDFDDFLLGDSGANKIEGGGGNDTIAGGGGTDKIDGGGDDDTFVFTDHLIGDGYIKGGTGTDAIVVSNVSGIYSIDLTDPLIESIEVLAFGAVANGGTGEVQFVGNQFGTGILSDASVIFSGNTNGVETVRIFMEGDIDLDLSKLVISGNGAEDTFAVEGGDADETIAGSALVDLIKGGNGADKIEGGLGSDIIEGGDGKDTIFGGVGVDTIDAGDGDDTITVRDNEALDHVDGGTGVDLFAFEDDQFGIVIDLAAGTLTSTIYGSFTAAGIENVDGTFVADTIKGDALVNVLRGRDGADELYGFGDNDTLDGGTGDDRMFGGSGNDTYYVDSLKDQVSEAAGSGTADIVAARASYVLAAGVDIEFLRTTSSGGAAKIDLTGNTLHQEIFGNAGANTLKDGGGAADVLKGLVGNDTYLVYAAGTTVTEGSTGGTDRVLAAVDFALGAGQYVESLATTNGSGTSGIDLTGNALAQSIKGNAGANILSDGGKGAADTMTGLGGNDTYRVYNSGDVIVEGATQGNTDRVAAAVDYTLGVGVHVEAMTTNGSTGTTGIDLTGNEVVQAITGNAGSNILDGQGGNDTLTGLGGKDFFVFSSALGATNVDKIIDFNVADDTIRLENAIFAALTTTGALSASLFKDTFASARDADDRILYNSNTGSLFYDADGTGSTFVAVKFAALAPGVALTAADFAVI